MSKTYMKIVKEDSLTFVQELDKKPEFKNDQIYFAVDNDYDFGSIDPKELVLEMYDAEQGKLPGIEILSWN